MTTFSFIIPTILKKGLNEAVESALSQTYNRFEVVVAGDGCTPPQFNNERVISLMCPRTGNQSATRMNAVHFCKGEWIVFLDDDDWVEPWYLESFIPHVSGDIIISQMNNYGNIIPAGYEIIHGSVGISFAVHKSILQQHPLPNPPSEDYVFLKQMENLGMDIKFTNRCGYYVRKYGK